MRVYRGLSIALMAGGLLAASPRADADPGSGQAEPANATRTVEPDTHRDRDSTRPRYGLMAAETVGVLIPPTIWYWSNTNLQTEDWDLHWNWTDWKTKLTSVDLVRFDTNRFAINTIRHPVGGALHYQVARANHFGILGSMLVDFTASAFWEYVVEFKENVSLNDLLVNTNAGLGIGEPLFEIGRMRWDPNPSWLRRALAFAVSPLAGVHDLAGVGDESPDPLVSTKLALEAGAGAVHFSGGAQRTEGRLGLDIEVVGQPGYGQPGHGASRTRPGQWSRIAVDLRLGRGAAGDELTSTRIRTRTTLMGRYERDIDDSGNGWGAFFGGASGFEYHTRRLADEWDRLALFHVVGPRLELTGYRGDLKLMWEAIAYGDFALVQAHVFGPVPPFMPVEPPTSVLRAQGYYYGLGPSFETRLSLEAGRWQAGIEGEADAYWSIDGRDRTEIGDSMDDPHDVTDQRVTARAIAGVDLMENVRLLVEGETVIRHGQWRDEERRTHERSMGATLSLSF